MWMFWMIGICVLLFVGLVVWVERKDKKRAEELYARRASGNRYFSSNASRQRSVDDEGLTMADVALAYAVLSSDDSSSSGCGDDSGYDSSSSYSSSSDSGYDSGSSFESSCGGSCGGCD